MTTEVRVTGKVDYDFHLVSKQRLVEVSPEKNLSVVPHERTGHFNMRDVATGVVSDVLVTDFPKHTLVRVGRGLKQARQGRTVRLVWEDRVVRVRKDSQTVLVGNANLHITHFRRPKSTNS